MLKQTDKRWHILSQSAVSELYSLPRLNNIQLEQSFSLADEELKAVNQQSSLGSKVNFIFLLGYFREKPLIAQFRFRDVRDDSKYVVNGITKGWAVRWQANGWMRTKKEKAINPDLWEKLLVLCGKHDVQFRWVKGHAGNEGNERCDQLATYEAAKVKLPVDEVYENNGFGR